MSGQHRVAVTGIGVLAPNGIGVEAFWSSILEQRSGIGPITRFDASRNRCRIAGEICDFDPLDYVDRALKPRRMARHTQLALAATRLAVEHGCVVLDDLGNHRPIPVMLGISTSAIELFELGIERLRKMGPDRVPSYLIPSGQPQAVAMALHSFLKVPAEYVTISTACAAGLDAVAKGAEVIRAGRSDLVIAGGSDAPINLLTFASLDAAGLMSTRNDDPRRANRPFDMSRDAGVISEGAGILILENLQHAQARGARPLAELLAHHTVIDAPGAQPAEGLANTMRMALADSGKRPEDVNYICAHGPGHPAIDRMETQTIKEVFGAVAYQIPVSSIKGVTGNPLAAAGVMQLAAAALAIDRGVIPPTTNLEVPDPDCDLDYVPEGPRRGDVRCALVNTHGLGGGNTTVVIQQVD